MDPPWSFSSNPLWDEVHIFTNVIFGPIPHRKSGFTIQRMSLLACSWFLVWARHQALHLIFVFLKSLGLWVKFMQAFIIITAIKYMYRSFVLAKRKIVGLVLNIHKFLFHEIRTIISPMDLQCCCQSSDLALARAPVPPIQGRRS